MRSRPFDQFARRLRAARHPVRLAHPGTAAAEAQRRVGEGEPGGVAWPWVEPLLEVVWTADSHGAWTSCGARWTEITGLDAAHTLGRGWAEAIEPGARESTLAAFTAAVKAGKPFTLEARVRDVGGQFRWRAFRAVPVRAAHGALVGWCGTCQDVDARHRTEDALRFLVALDTAIGETLTVADTVTAVTRGVVPFLADACLIDLLEPDGTLRRVTPGDAAAWAGFAHVPRVAPRATARRDPIDNALRRARPVHVAHVTAAWRMAVAQHAARGNGHGGSPSSTAAARASGDPSAELPPKAHEALHLPLVAHGRAVGVLTLITTAPGRRFDAAAQGLARDVAQRVAIALDHAQRLAAAEQATRAREEFIAVASHELKGPLTALLLTVQRVRQFAQRAAAGPLAPPQESLLGHAIGLAERQVRRLASLLDDLFDFARMREGRLELRREPCDLAALVREIVARLDEDLGTTKTPVRLEAPEGPVEGQWDRARLDQVVTNLLGNALKYGLGRPVTVRLDATDARARVSVSDQGIGIAPADRERIFDRFERAPGAARQRPGLGLGLYIARAIVHAHGGTIRVESTPGEGSTFFVELPRRAT